MHQLSLICILEPFISTDRLEATRVCLGMDHVLSSQSGKIWVFYSIPFLVKLLEDMDQVIYCWATYSLLSNLYLFLMYILIVLHMCERICGKPLWWACRTSEGNWRF